MIDRIGELLESLAAEDDEQEQEEIPVRRRGAVVSSGLRSERSESGEIPEGRTAFAQSESSGRAAYRNSVTAEKREAAADRSGVTAGEITSEQPELTAGELWTVGPIWAARGGTISPVSEDTARGGLEGLYRQSVRGLRSAAPALPPEQAGRTARTQEPGSAVSPTVDELDRAVRRDSRRYDGGMSIY